MDMNNKIVVSVIIPTYNRCNNVQEAIDSVLAQSYKNYELIVIDDGSTDGTDEVIKSKYNGKLKYIWQENQERSKARNRGISLSSGKYLAFLDSDDKWHPDKLMNQVKVLEESRKKDSDIALVCSSVWLIDCDGNLLTSNLAGRKTNLEKFQLADYLHGPRIFAPPSNALYYSEFVKQVGGFDEDIVPVEDWGLLIKLREKYKFIYLDKPLTYYRACNVKQQGFPYYEEIEKRLSVFLKLHDKFPKSKLTLEQINHAKAQLYERAAYWYFNYHDWQNGIKYLHRADDLSPDCTGNKKKVVQMVASVGLKSALYNSGNTVQDLLNYFKETYYANLCNIWPNGLLSQTDVKRKVMATFCHILVCDENITKTREEIIQLSIQAFSYGRYLRSIKTWKIYLKNLLPLIIK